MTGRGGGPSTLQLALRAYLSAAHPQRIWDPLPLRMNQKPVKAPLQCANGWAAWGTGTPDSSVTLKTAGTVRI